MKAYWKLTLAVLHSEESTAQMRQQAAESLLDLFCDSYLEFKNPQIDDEWHAMILDACIRYMTIRATATTETPPVESTTVCGVLKDCLFNMDWNISSNDMINHETLLPWIFERILSEDDKEHGAYADVLSYIFIRADAPGRVAIIIRHHNSLRKAVCDILTRKVHCGDFAIFELFSDDEMCGFMASVAYPFHQWVMKWIPKDCDDNRALFQEHWDELKFVVDVLRNTMDSTKLLEELLGYDILRVAHYLAFIPEATDEQASIFRSILSKYPKFNESFRKRTCDGDEGNPIARLGRMIPPKAPTVAKLYIFEDED